LAIAGLASLVAWLMFDARFSLFAVVLFLQVLFTFAFRKQIQHLANTADEAGSGLAILSQVLELLERERFQSPGLAAIRAWLDTEGMMPSKRIAQLHGLIQSLNNSMKNQFFAPLAILLCLPVQLVHRIEVWRGRVGTHIPEWLEAVGQFEALSSLAGYAYEHPADPFPELVTEGPLFTGEALGHPLLPDSECIRNDLTLNAEKRLILISGSNMSGKSTLLRTVGTNVVLALAGAPVRAARLQLSRVEIGSAMRINDSLQDGRSLFYTSLSRLKAVVDLSSQSVPLLFMLDEILQGTNSHDRRIGAEGIIRRLIEGGAAGIVTTHDLALTKIVDAHDAHAVNMHFEDHFIDGKMTFDYRIRPGVVQRSNALELMRMMGLDV
jgi:CBS domain-containing protein